MRSNEELKEIATKIRKDIFRMFWVSKTGHLAPALSCTDIFAVLYFLPVINWGKRFDDDRDRVILSKGHGCAALYATLARGGYFDRTELLTFYQKGTLLGGHPVVDLEGIESATGALGHGICFATGTAMAAKISQSGFKTYVVVGDGECEEGSVWEAAMFAANQGLEDLIVVVDRNGLQASDYVDRVLHEEPFAEKWKAFGWNVLEADGHDFDSLRGAFVQAWDGKGMPTVIIAKTVKGKGFSLAEDNADWHSRAPQKEEWEVLCKEYGMDVEELASV